MAENSGRRPSKVLAVASGGGHWVQLLRLRPAFDGLDVTFVSTRRDLRSDVAGAPFRVVPDANRWDKWGVARCVLAMTWVLLVERPRVVVTTGAAPGYLAVRIAKLIRAHTIWVDSIANVEEMSLSGRKALDTADLCITQWEHLATQDGPHYFGSVLG